MKLNIGLRLITSDIIEKVWFDVLELMKKFYRLMFLTEAIQLIWKVMFPITFGR